MIKLTPIQNIVPASYNPRKVDPARLDLVELSIRKLGFVLPLYATSEGVILSGHQRAHVATRLGYTQLPVEVLPPMSMHEAKAVNILFNRATNDMEASTTPEQISKQLANRNVEEMSKALADVNIFDAPPCMKLTMLPTKDLTKANRGQWKQYARNVALSMSIKKIHMPLVVSEDLSVVNGIGRLQLYAERKASEVPCVVISNQQAAFAAAMLNLLSMDFDIHNRYQDLLRYGSFRRERLKRKNLGWGFIFKVFRSGSAKDYDIKILKNAQTWRATYGTSIVDFGSGQQTEADMLRNIGVHVASFEPFRTDGGNTIDKDLSIATAKAFLQDVGSGRDYDSVFISSVLNSVPFTEDRRKIVEICAALCGARTTLYICTTGADHSNLEGVTGKQMLSKDRMNRATFQLGYEPGIVMGDVTTSPKVQKYHTTQEVLDLLEPHFVDISLSTYGGNIFATASGMRKINPITLREALEFEFNLPYPDGTRMGLVSEALAAFSKRLKIEL